MPFWVSGTQAPVLANSATLAARFPILRISGIERRSGRWPMTTSALSLASTNAGMRVGSCWPSESSMTIASGGVGSESRREAPAATALPLPPFEGEAKDAHPIVVGECVERT